MMIPRGWLKFACLAIVTHVSVTEAADARAAQREFVKRGLIAEAAGDWVSPDVAFTAVRKAAARAGRKG